MTRQTKHASSRLTKEIIHFVLLMLAVFIGVQLLTSFVISKDVVQGISMEPTLKQNDRLLSLRHHAINRNDIVVLEAPDAKNQLYIKRVIGLPGDSVQVINDKLYLNGHYQPESYLDKTFDQRELAELKAKNEIAPDANFTNDFSLQTLQSTQRATVPAGEYFVMGDNRIRSHDGRNFGFIKKDTIQSVVVWRYWPLSRWKTF